MNLFFVFDTTYCKADEDDPKDAVMYFFPAQASESQNYLLCCQLAGVAKFLKTTFSSPSVIGLNQGKFAFLWSGKYLLVLGTNASVKTSVLRDQLLFLCGIFCFYHGSIDNVLKECKNNRDECMAKLELAWSRYISLSQRFGNVLQISLSVAPLNNHKKNSAVVTSADRLLHMCQMSSAVVAGAVFYNSRVLSTQFMQQLTSYLSLMSNSNASAPVSDAIHPIKNLPPDVELKYVYLSSKWIADILKYNHTSVGSRIRMKTTVKPSQLKPCVSLPQGGTISSGSEGDVDSGNCSDIAHCNKRGDKFCDSLKNARCSSFMKLCKYKKQNYHPCCSGHSKLFARSVFRSRNHSLLKLIHDTSPNCAKQRKDDAHDSGFHLVRESTTNDNLKSNSNLKAVNVLCHLHAQLLASSFVSHSKLKHTNFMSLSDLEYKCSLCFNYQNFKPINQVSLKQWNSDLSLSDLTRDTYDISPLLKCRDIPTIGQLETSKLQVLRCRSSSNSCSSRFNRTKSHSASKRLFIDSTSGGDIKSTGATTKLRNFQLNSDEKFENIENNELQKHVLYVQRYGGATLLLLLNKAYDEKVIHYLWNCGFTILRDLEFDSEKQPPEDIFTFLDPSFYVLLYSHVQKILREYPRFPPLLLTEKNTRESIQDIQQEFLNDPYFKMMCLLSANQGIFAAQKDQHSAFYLQPEVNSRKPESLYSLCTKATKRLGKHFKIML